jgi:hypothetical protein
VLEGEVEFELGGERLTAKQGTVVAVTDPSVRRSAVARSAEATVLAVGTRSGSFATTWRDSHFADVPRAEESG